MKEHEIQDHKFKKKYNKNMKTGQKKIKKIKIQQKTKKKKKQKRTQQKNKQRSVMKKKHKTSEYRTKVHGKAMYFYIKKGKKKLNRQQIKEETTN